MAARRRPAPERRTPSIFWFFAALAAVPLEAMFKYRIDGELPRTGPYILTPNHYSDLDPVTTGYAIWKLGRKPVFMAKASLFKVPVVGKLLTASGQIPVERERGAAKQGTMNAARQLVENGSAVIIYPEGTLTREPDGWPMRGKPGAVRLALETGVPIIPIATMGADAVMPRFARTKKFRFRLRTPLHVKVGHPVDLSAFQGRAHSRTAVTAATELVMTEITRLLEELRGETAPAERYDPAKHGQTEFGMPEPAPVMTPAAQPNGKPDRPAAKWTAEELAASVLAASVPAEASAAEATAAEVTATPAASADREPMA